MLYDLNIPWAPSLDRADLEQTLAFSASLGYNVVALNHTISPPIPPQITNPLPKFDDTTQPSSPSPSTSSPRLPTILRRVTVLLDDPSQNFRIAALASHYDILAVRPTSERAFSNACLNPSECSIISLDLSQRFAFHFRPKPCMAAVSRGVRFEVCYAHALGPSPAARALFIANLASLVRATRGRGIIVSSEARSALALRGPADVANLLSVWGLPKEKGMEALGSGPRGVVVNERLKRSSYKGVVNIVETAPRPQRPAVSGSDDAASSAAAAGGAEGKGAAGKGARQQKRKVSELTGGLQPSAAAGGQNTVSKRQAKKMKQQQQAAGKP
ncbi:RNase P subunit p30 [Plectosphaerella cucumerina]|uniref:RNase P subunit p30 n=1 Tax=Plectosphaerella cucumerina TaxID=40658 RepID=A0A8K0XA75_9PEZI|nr:RNase P subunit p30 [Plectosphaerella cucumerina]